MLPFGVVVHDLVGRLAFWTGFMLLVLLPNDVVDGQMVKMCLFYNDPSGHARSDPIINQECVSDHIHTFYGPLNFHPNTTYENLRATSSNFSTTPFIENQSLYWHPTIYQVIENNEESGEDENMTYVRAPKLFTSPYYRWIRGDGFETEEFPPGFRMIAHSDDQGAQEAGESGGNMLVECCDLIEGDEDCEEWDFFRFPERSCDFLGIAFAMPTCWNGELGIDNGPGHKDHMAYTLDGRVDGDCPDSHPRRLPQIQLFVRVNDYQGGNYILSDGNSDKFHVDFMNGWQNRTLQTIIDECEVLGDGDPDNYNPPCNCDHLLTENTEKSGTACDDDIRELIVDEPTDVVVGESLPRGTCIVEDGVDLVAKSWDVVPPLACATVPTESGSGDEEDEGSEDYNICEDECCFINLEQCEALVEIMCGDETFGTNCQQECQTLDEEEVFEDGNVQDCFDDCITFQENCYQRQERLCEPCGEEENEDCEFESLEECESEVEEICGDDADCIEEEGELMCGPCEDSDEEDGCEFDSFEECEEEVGEICGDDADCFEEEEEVMCGPCEDR